MAQEQNKQEQDIHQLLKVRREKLSELQNAGKDPFQITKYDQTHHSAEVKSLYEAHEAEILAGRAPLNTEGMDEAQAREAAKKEEELTGSILPEGTEEELMAGEAEEE